MSGTLDNSVLNYYFSVQHFAEISNDTLGAYGIQAGSVTVNGIWEDNASIDASVENISFIIDQKNMKKSRTKSTKTSTTTTSTSGEGEGTAEGTSEDEPFAYDEYWEVFTATGMSNNKLSAYGISASDIVLNSLGKEHENSNGIYFTKSAGAFSTSIKNILFQSEYV